LSEISKELPKYFMQKTVLPYQAKEWAKKKSKLKKAFTPANFIKQDGLKIIGKDYWVHIRPSNTEPIIRLIAESKFQKYTSELIDKVKKIFVE